MAKNKNGQTVKNKKYYKKKNTPNSSKKKNTKKKTKKVENNVSIIVDNKKEALNYNIVEEEKVVEENKEIDVPVEDKEEFDYRTKKVKFDRKIKTNFVDENFDEKFLFSDEVEEKKPKKKKNKNKKKKEKVIEEKPIDINIEDHSDEETVFVDNSMELPSEESNEVSEKEKVDISEEDKVQEDKSLVDKAFEESDNDIGDIDKPAIFRNLNSDEGSFGRFIIKLFVLLIILILSIFFVISFSTKYMNTTTTKDVGYFESSDIEYSLCNGGKCINNNIIDRNIDTINVKFEYGLSFDEKINFDGKYNIVAKFSINDDKTGDVLYTENKDIKKDTFNEKNIQDFEIKDDAIVLLNDYRKYLAKYNKDRKSNYTGEVRVNLYVDGVNGKKRVSSLLIPLQDRSEIERTNIAYQAGDASIEDDGTHYGKVYVYLIIVSLVLVVASSIGVVLLLSGAEDEEEE